MALLPQEGRDADEFVGWAELAKPNKMLLGNTVGLRKLSPTYI